MRGFSIKTLFRGFIKVLVFVAAWVLIHVALVSSLLPPFSPWTRFAVFLFPAILIAFLIIRWSLRRQPKQEKSRFAFSVAGIACFLFLSTSVVIFKTGGLES